MHCQQSSFQRKLSCKCSGNCIASACIFGASSCNANTCRLRALCVTSMQRVAECQVAISAHGGHVHTGVPHDGHGCPLGHTSGGFRLDIHFTLGDGGGVGGGEGGVGGGGGGGCGVLHVPAQVVLFANVPL